MTSNGHEPPTAPIPTRRIVDEVKTSTAGVSVWWTGNNGWLIRSGAALIATDPVMEDENRSAQAPISAAEVAPLLDIVFITHAHGDHFNHRTAHILAEQGACLFVLPASCLADAQRIGIPDARIKVARPRTPFELGSVQVWPLRAIHGTARHAVYYDANLDDCGYRLALAGRTFLQPGDSVLLEDHLFLERVDVLFFSPTEHNTFIDASVILINTLEPAYILPQHRDTYHVTPENRFWTHAYPHEVKLRLPTSLQARYHILDQGERLVIPPAEPG